MPQPANGSSSTSNTKKGVITFFLRDVFERIAVAAAANEGAVVVGSVGIYLLRYLIMLNLILLI